MNDYTLNGIRFNIGHPNLCGTAKYCDPTQPEGASDYVYGNSREMSAFIERTTHLRCLVDIGADAGIFSLIFTRHPEAVAYAVEPSPWGYPALVSNCAANPERRIFTVPAFFGSINGLPVSVSKACTHAIADEGGGESWQLKHCGKVLEPTAATLFAVRLDDLEWSQNRSIDCVKIDVEGYECEVLRGMPNLIARCRPLMFLEVHTGTLPGHNETPERLYGMVREYGYRIENFDGKEETTFADCSLKRVLCLPE